MYGFWKSVCILLFSLVIVSAAPAGEDLSVNGELHLDPDKVLTYRECMKCHTSEIEVWKETPHFKTFDTLHRRKAAKEIAGKMGIKSLKRSQVCTQCHYTLASDSRGKPKVCSGVSCESCHGAAEDWIEKHADYGGPNVTREQETPEHKKQRRELAMSLGMNNPTNLYLIARNCYNCHTVPNEKLVNVGGHPAGSKFELVSWSQGMIRHNFVSSNGKENLKKPVERIRAMFIVGLMADLEYSLRSVSKATERDEFAFRMAKRVEVARKRLKKAHSMTNHALIGKAVEAGYFAKLQLNNTQQLQEAAEMIASIGEEFSDTEDGTNLAGVDRLLPPERVFK
jgi:hypothetical protein